jgi:hypothetical protein
MHPHPFTLREVELLHAANVPAPRTRGHAASRPRRRRRWQRWAAARRREHAELSIFAVDAEELTAQLVTHSPR